MLPRLLMLRVFLTVMLTTLLCACSPQFNWREVHGSDVPFTILLPGKYTSASRELVLAGQSHKMFMTGAEAGDASFAVGAVRVADAVQESEVQQAMQDGLLKNIQAGARQTGIDGILRAQGTTPQGQPIYLAARFVNAETTVYQLVIMGSKQAMQAEVVDTFMTSFQPH